MKTISKIYQPFGGGDRKEEKGELEGKNEGQKEGRISIAPQFRQAIASADEEGAVQKNRIAGRWEKTGNGAVEKGEKENKGKHVNVGPSSGSCLFGGRKGRSGAQQKSKSVGKYLRQITD